jgi:hypothetical protein
MLLQSPDANQVSPYHQRASASWHKLSFLGMVINKTMPDCFLLICSQLKTDAAKEPAPNLLKKTQQIGVEAISFNIID